MVTKRVTNLSKNTKKCYIFKDLVNNRLLIPRVIQGVKDMTNIKSQNEIRPLTVEELQNWIEEEQAILKMVQDYKSELPEGRREQFEMLCFGVWNCLDNLRGMLEDNELKYYPKELRKRKRVEYAKLMRQSRKGSYGNK